MSRQRYEEAVGALRATRGPTDREVETFVARAAREVPRPARARWRGPAVMGAAVAAVAAALVVLLWPTRQPLVMSRHVSIAPGQPPAALAAGELPIRATERGVATLRIEPWSALSIERWEAGSIVARLAQGTVTADVEPRRPGQDVVVLAGRLRVRVIGTIFAVTHFPARGTLVSTREGAVAVETLAGTRLAIVRAGQQRFIPARSEPVAAAGTPSDVTTGPRDLRERASRGLVSAAPAAEARPPPLLSGGYSRGTTWTEMPGDIVRRVLGSSAPRAAATVGEPEASPTRPEPQSVIARRTQEGAAVVAVTRRPLATAVASRARPARRRAPLVQRREQAAAVAAPAEPPFDASAALAQARGNLARGRIAAATEALEAAVEAAPAHGGLLALLGDAHHLGGRLDEAEARYRQALRRGAPEATIRHDLARIYVAQERWADASREWTAILTRLPRSPLAPTALRGLASAAAARGDTAAEEQALARILDDHPTAPEASGALATLLRRHLSRGALEAADAVSSRMLARGGPAAREVALVGLTRVRLRQGRLNEAAALLAQHAREFPRGARAREMQSLREALGTLAPAAGTDG